MLRSGQIRGAGARFTAILGVDVNKARDGAENDLLNWRKV